MTSPKTPATPEDNTLPTFGYCKHCGRVIAWDEWSYTHLDGWANCRKASEPSELDPSVHCALDTEHPIDPQPATVADCYSTPMIGRSHLSALGDREYNSWLPGRLRRAEDLTVEEVGKAMSAGEVLTIDARTE